MNAVSALSTAVLVTLAASVGCRGQAQRDAEALNRADAAATRLGGALRSKLTEAIAQAGPSRAVDVCANEAQSVRSEVGRASQVTLGRASLRLRTSADAAPEWVTDWLKAQGERKVEGITGVRDVVATPGGRVARVLRPIPVEAPCLACHGEESQIDPVVRAAIRARYPSDAATGYHLGDLRGALWVEAPVE
jgi:Protein of unknown function (DUF3365)